MNQNEILANVVEIIKTDLPDLQIEKAEICEANSDESYIRINVTVPRPQINNLCEYLFAHKDVFEKISRKYFISVSPRIGISHLVPAEIGDFVLTESGHGEIENANIAIVTKKIQINNKTKYRVRMIVPVWALDNRWLDGEPFSIHGEDYSGWDEGFIGVISPEKAIQLLTKKIEINKIKLLARLEEQHKDFESRVTNLIQELSSNQTTVTTLMIKSGNSKDIPRDMLAGE